MIVVWMDGHPGVSCGVILFGNLATIEHVFTETLSKLCEYCFVARIFNNDKPTNDRTDACIGMFLPFDITVDNYALGGDDIYYCYLFGS